MKSREREIEKEDMGTHAGWLVSHSLDVDSLLLRQLEQLRSSAEAEGFNKTRAKALQKLIQ